jgi:triosephosphate isomerase
LELTRKASAALGCLVAAQNMHQEAAGAYTGEVAANMLTDLGIAWTLVGHSERRQYYGETNELVANKARVAQNAGINPIVCIGETLSERQSGNMEAVLSAQLEAVTAKIDPTKPFVLAYEPVWAIGTGVTASNAQAQEAHAFIRKFVAGKLGTSLANSLRILYGGSVNAGNSKALLEQADIDGALVGGASLKPQEFAAIIQS